MRVATAEDLRREAAEHYEAAEESFQRCDTDGFLSQWAHGINGQLAQRKADILEAGGKDRYLVILDGDGNVVPSKAVDTKYGTKRVTLKENGDFDCWYSYADGPRSKIVKDGLRYGYVLHTGQAFLAGRGRGLSGTCWVASKPTCEECGTFIESIGRPCRCGHTTGFEVLEDEGE